MLLQYEIHRVAGRPDNMAVIWLLKTLMTGMTFEKLAVSGPRFYRLDVLLATWFLKYAKGIFKTELNLKAYEITQGYYAPDGTWMPQELIKGRQILWLLNDDLKKDEDVAIIFNVLHLINCDLKDGERNIAGLQNFIARWHDILGGLDEQPTESMKRTLFHKQFSKVPDLREVIYHFDYVGKDHPDHSYDYLLTECVGDSLE